MEPEYLTPDESESENTADTVAVAAAPQPDLKDAFITYLLENGQRPPSVFKFARDLGISESAFYTQYNSFDALEKDIWTGYATQAIDTVTSDPVYAGYTIREKLLSFYFTLVQNLLTNRSYVLLTLKGGHEPLRIFPSVLSGFRKVFVEYAKNLVAMGLADGEIAARPYITDKYGESLWLQLMFVINFWLKDESAGFEKTDAAIEKAVNLSMDVMGRNTLDSAFDFAKFLFQSRKN
ncbi:MAG: TetR family transcriptional regulator C-terminal domain-containing protein [Bacteroidota bacterium]